MEGVKTVDRKVCEESSLAHIQVIKWVREQQREEEIETEDGLKDLHSPSMYSVHTDILYTCR